MADTFIVHCSYCGYNHKSGSSSPDQECPECGHRASKATPEEDSKHEVDIKTNYSGTPLDETENKIP